MDQAWPQFRAHFRSDLACSTTGHRRQDRLRQPQRLGRFLAIGEHVPVESKHRINRTLAFNTLRRLLPRALALRIVGYNTFAEALAEIAKNLQTFVKNRRRPRPPLPKPHKSNACKPGV